MLKIGRKIFKIYFLLHLNAKNIFHLPSFRRYLSEKSIYEAMMQYRNVY